jgi:hypothetical protein
MSNIFTKELAIVTEMITNNEMPMQDGKLLSVKILSKDPAVTSPEFQVIQQARQDLYQYLQDNKDKLVAPSTYETENDTETDTETNETEKEIDIE